MRKYLQIIDRHRATKGMRFANILVDRIAFNLIFFALGLAGGILDGIFGMYYFTKFFDQLAELGRVADIIITSVIFFFYIFLIEYLTKGRSLGKFVTGTKVLMTDGTEPTVKDYFNRNIIRLVPFDALSFFGENGWHDSWSDTRVINIRNYEAERQSKNEIDAIGVKEIA